MEYRREIDGLRALAVLPVILFHAGFHAFGGGFVGVDVFFVISGYLITSIILAELARGRFSIAGFYERRARRILPALFLVMLVTLPLAWLWLLPSDLRDYAQSLVAVPLFASNILFWRKSGYFDAAAELQPLLHTWSLAVEEQYYLLFPLLLMLAWRFGRRWIAVLLGLVFAASLGLAQWSVTASPAAAFYLLPSRGWELLAGAFAALYLSRDQMPAAPRWLAEAGGVAGCALITHAVLAFDRQTPFPGLHALVPALGTVLVILCATPQTFVGRLLGHRVCVGIGLASYSAYLWHQPLIAFVKIGSAGEPSTATMLGVLALVAVLAWLSWRWVERPFRDRSRFSRRRIFTLALAGSLSFCACGFLLGAKGQPLVAQRYSAQERAVLDWSFYSGREDFKRAWELGSCYIESGTNTWADFDQGRCLGLSDTQPNVLLVGDSHAAQIVAALRGVRGIHLLPMLSSGCRPYPQAEGELNCLRRNDFLFRSFLPAHRGRLAAVVLTAGWKRGEAAGLDAALERFAAAGVRVVLVGEKPAFVKPVPNIAVRLMRSGQAGPWAGASWLDHGTMLDDADIAQVASRHPGRVELVTVMDRFCDAARCRLFGEDGGLLFFDAQHFTPAASRLFVEQALAPHLPASGARP